jgi:NAD(P) transhydrogenase subunit alpha
MTESLGARIGVVNESGRGETRVAGTPGTVKALIGLGYRVAVATDAGAAAGFPDAAFKDAGAEVVDSMTAWSADVVFAIGPPSDDEIRQVRPGATLICLLSPNLEPARVELLQTLPITALAMDAVPRISRAQSMDVLSSMANIAGYRAVIEAAHRFGRFFTGQVTAAGKVPPASTSAWRWSRKRSAMSASTWAG